MRLGSAGPLLAVLAVAVATAFGATALANGSTRPTLRIENATPLTVRGTGFHPREHVRVVLVIKSTTTRRTTASARGTFTVRFPGADTNACAGLSVTAVGSDGSRASWKRSPGMCALP